MEKLDDIFIGKTVLNAKGAIIGIIQASIVDDRSGEITSVLVKPQKEVNLQNYSVTERGDIIFPCTSLASVKDVIIVEDTPK